MTTETPYSLDAARALALHAQGLSASASPTSVTPDRLYDTVERLGAVQIDTLQMVRRSHYLVLWSRLGHYDPADFDNLVYDADARRLFEYWWHAACIIPLREYRYVLPTMRSYADGSSNRYAEWVRDNDVKSIARSVKKRIRHEGGLRVADFKDEREEKRGEWWDWKPAKSALEYLYDRGDMMIANRVNFQRIYDLRERVLPEWVDQSEPTPEETRRYLLERSLRSLGICQPAQVADYTHMKRGEARPIVEQLLADGVFVPVTVTLSDGEAHEVVVHREDLSLLAQAADGDLPAGRTTFLSPFDSLFWARGRDEQVWGFRQVLEAYKPAKQREWGYFCLPILHHDALVGRFDPKLERKTGTLRFKALYLEPGVSPDEELVSAVASAMRDFMAFHDATELVIERSQPAAFGKKLMAAM